jgi:hypothetical protein
MGPTLDAGMTGTPQWVLRSTRINEAAFCSLVRYTTRSSIFSLLMFTEQQRCL